MGKVLTVIVGVIFICKEQPVVAKTLNVVVAVKIPVGKLIIAPVPVTGDPMRELSLLFLN